MFATLKNTAVAATIAGLTWSAPAAACSFDGLVVGNMDVAFPGSLSVSLSIANARAAGKLPLAPELSGTDGLARAQATMEALRDELADDFGARPQTFSILFTGSRLWSVVNGRDGNVRLNFHAGGPMLGQPVILTEQVVLDAILDGSLSIDEAKSSGLLVVKKDRGNNIEMLMTQALASV